MLISVQDHSHGSGLTRIQAHLSEEEAKSLMQTRFQIIKFVIFSFFQCKAGLTTQRMATSFWAP